MTEIEDWEIPAGAQPNPASCDYDLDAALSSVVALHSRIPHDAFTAPILGTERSGNAVVIGDSGLVLTIGYLITEATEIWLTTNGGVAARADVTAYDPETGFALLQVLGRLGVPALERGSSKASRTGDQVVFAGVGGQRRALQAMIAAKREFAGYWEYVLDEAIFTTPAYPHWGGAAMIGQDGKLQGIGSLYIQDMDLDGEQREGNMIVPIDLLEPIFEDMTTLGRVNRPARPWLGLYASDSEDYPIVIGLAENGPAHDAGIEPGDQVMEVGGKTVEDLAAFFREVWAQGPAGTAISLTVSRNEEERQVNVISMNRNDLLRKPEFH